MRAYADNSAALNSKPENLTAIRFIDDTSGEVKITIRTIAYKTFFKKISDLGMAKFWEDNIGTILYELRIKHEYSQEELANLSDVDRSYISEIERGLKVPSIVVISKLCKILGLKTWEFIRKAEEQ